jgi:hypothetical protein
MRSSSFGTGDIGEAGLEDDGDGNILVVFVVFMVIIIYLVC